MKLKSIFAALLAFALMGCNTRPAADPLPSWNDTPLKQQIVNYMETQVPQIPIEDRVAVLDMDGTIMCETPLWAEMAVAAQKLVDRMQENPELGQLTHYQYAQKIVKNPMDTSVLKHWYDNGKNYKDSVLLQAFAGVDNEEYVAYSKDYLSKTPIAKYGMPYTKCFYQPMLELMDYMKAKDFQIYIVSGTVQTVLWSFLPDALGLDRSHLIGKLHPFDVVYPKDGEASFIMQEGILQPKNGRDGKCINIYNRCGKVPVVAIGNSVGDFSMLRFAATSSHPSLSMVIIHDDAQREFQYPPYHGRPLEGWQDTIKAHNWLRADMSKEFKVMWQTAR